MESFIKLLLFTENVLGVFRKCAFFYAPPRDFALLIIVCVEVILALLDVTVRINYFWEEYLSEVLNILSNLISTVIIIIALFHSKSYICYIAVLQKTNDYFTNDIHYNKSIKKRKMCYKILLACITLLVMLTHFQEIFLKIENKILLFFYILNSFSCDIRISVQYLIIHSHLFILSEQIKFLSRKLNCPEISIAAVYGIGDLSIRRQIRKEEDKEYCNLTFEELSYLYSNIKKSSEFINLIFGLQVK